MAKKCTAWQTEYFFIHMVKRVCEGSGNTFIAAVSFVNNLWGFKGWPSIYFSGNCLAV